MIFTLSSFVEQIISLSLLEAQLKSLSLTFLLERETFVVRSCSSREKRVIKPFVSWEDRHTSAILIILGFVLLFPLLV